MKIVFNDVNGNVYQVPKENIDGVESKYNFLLGIKFYIRVRGRVIEITEQEYDNISNKL